MKVSTRIYKSIFPCIVFGVIYVVDFLSLYYTGM